MSQKEFKMAAIEVTVANVHLPHLQSDVSKYRVKDGLFVSSQTSQEQLQQPEPRLTILQRISNFFKNLFQASGASKSSPPVPVTSVSATNIYASVVASIIDDLVPVAFVVGVVGSDADREANVFNGLKNQGPE